jgi:hypothetical protein
MGEVRHFAAESMGAIKEQGNKAYSAMIDQYGRPSRGSAVCVNLKNTTSVDFVK